jgi:hypothetical protein
MPSPTDIRNVPLADVLAAIRALGVDPPHDVHEVQITLHEVTICYHDRYEGRLTGGRVQHTVPIDRSAGG